jgi:hypothetical protein
LALLFYGRLFFIHKGKKGIFFSLSLFSLLCLVTLTSIFSSFSEYLYQLIIFNKNVALPAEAKGDSLFFRFLTGIFYPVAILFSTKWNHLRVVLIGLSVVFLFSSTLLALKLRRFTLSIFVILVLGFLAIRSVYPATLFFEAFHMVVWFGVFVMAAILSSFVLYENKKTKRTGRILLIALAGVFLFAISPSSFLWEKVNRDEEFTRNYAHYYVNGEVIRVLSKRGDTLFAYMWDYFIHWQSKLDSSYPFAIYSFSTEGDGRFRVLRDRMFIKNPPSFYYTYCPKDVFASPYISSESAVSYRQLWRNGNPTCTYIQKAKIQEISKEQWSKAASLGFYLP